MRFLRSLLTAAALSGALVPAMAHADALPPDACLSTDVGKACSNAGADADESGTCITAKCSSPRPDGASVESDCGRCEGKATGSSSSGGSSGASSSGATIKPGGTEDAEGGGCSTSQKRDSLAGGGMLALGLLALAWSRRTRG